MQRTVTVNDRRRHLYFLRKQKSGSASFKMHSR